MNDLIVASLPEQNIFDKILPHIIVSSYQTVCYPKPDSCFTVSRELTDTEFEAIKNRYNPDKGFEIEYLENIIADLQIEVELEGIDEQQGYDPMTWVIENQDGSIYHSTLEMWDSFLEYSHWNGNRWENIELEEIILEGEVEWYSLDEYSIEYSAYIFNNQFHHGDIAKIEGDRYVIRSYDLYCDTMVSANIFSKEEAILWLEKNSRKFTDYFNK